MGSSPRLEELRRRVQKDPASIAFAQLAEEWRRAGDYDEAVRVARDGLVRHPGYLSARVTLGCALLELGQLDAAQAELDTVLKSAPENLAAIRALADIHQRRGETAEPVSVPASEPVAPGPIAPEPVAPPVAPALVAANAEEAFVAPPSAPSLDRGLELDLPEFNSALESLDALTLDLPNAIPDAAPLDAGFDLGSFQMSEPSALEIPSAGWSLDSLDVPAAPVSRPEPTAKTAAPQEPARGDVALEALEHWLSAVTIDRANRRRATRS